MFYLHVLDPAGERAARHCFLSVAILHGRRSLCRWLVFDAEGLCVASGGAR
jgi:hypothetical protein